MPGPRQIVDPPKFTPTPFGLLSVVEFPPLDGSHWENGITYQPVCGDATSTYDECIAVTGAGGAPPIPQSTFNQSTITHVPRGSTPFTVMVEFDCAAVGNSQARQIAETAMAGNESWQVERSFWTGLAGTAVSGPQPVVWPHLAANAVLLDQQGIMIQSAAVNVTGVSTEVFPNDIVQALGELEGALADCYNGVGVIHVPQHLLPSLDAWGLVSQQGPQLRTKNGNRVAVGAGYPGTSPAGAVRTKDASWMYATGSVFCFRSGITIRANDTQSFDKQKNTIKMIAERRYVLGWDCCHFAVNAAMGVITPT
jgi:hypothetical protein